MSKIRLAIKIWFEKSWNNKNKSSFFLKHCLCAQKHLRDLFLVISLIDAEPLTRRNNLSLPKWSKFDTQIQLNPFTQLIQWTRL